MNRDNLTIWNAFSETYLTDLFSNSFIQAVGENGYLIEITVV
jgi:hypothetical protein